jgi:Integrase core domain/HTH-like domain
VSCGAVHSQALEIVAQGFTATLVAATLSISRSSLYYRKQPWESRADQQYDEQIVVAFGEKPAYGYRRVAWWLRRKENLAVNRKRVLRVTPERELLVRSRRLRARRKTRFIETLNRLESPIDARAYNHPEGNSYIEWFHRSLKEEEVWIAEYRDMQEARASIARWIEEYNHDRPHRGVQNRTPHEAFLGFVS